MNLTIRKINAEIERVANLECRDDVHGSVVEAYYESDTNRVNIVGEPYTNMCNYGRVRAFVAENLGLSDIHEGKKGYRDEKGNIIGHFVPEECEVISV